MLAREDLESLFNCYLLGLINRQWSLVYSLAWAEERCGQEKIPE